MISDEFSDDPPLMAAEEPLPMIVAPIVDDSPDAPRSGEIEMDSDPGMSNGEAPTFQGEIAPEASEPDGYQEAAELAVPEPAAYRETAVADEPRSSQGTAVTPWPDDAPSGASAEHGADADSTENLPLPTHAEWRQLADEVRRLTAQIAHGRA